MTNWNIPNFTPELQQKWEAKGFSEEEVKEWMEFGLKPEEADFADWLKKKYNVTTEEWLGDDDMKELRHRYKMEENTEEETPTQEEELANSKLPTIALWVGGGVILLLLIVFIYKLIRKFMWNYG